METKKKLKRRVLTIVILIVILVAAAAIYHVVTNSGSSDSLSFADVEEQIAESVAALSDKAVEQATLEGHTLVAANDAYELYLYEPALSILVRNKKTGAVMESTVRDEESLAKVNDTWKGFLQSGVVVELQEDTNTMQKKIGLESSGARVSVEKIPGGFHARLDYPSYELGFEVEVKLYDDGSITAYIPENSIYENAENKKIGNIYLFPLLGNTKLGEVDGYMFVPDGNGALIYLDDKEGRFDSGYVQKVYGSDVGVGESYVLSLLWSQYETHNDPEQILAPVYGMVHTTDGMGYLAVIENGEEEASIYATPNGAYSDYNWVTASFRKSTTYIQPTSNSGGSVTKVTDRIQYDIKIRYLFVEEEEADYAGLAKRYRNYLLEKGELSQKEDEFRIRLDFLGSDVENWMLWKKAVPVTTVDNIREIYDELEARGVTDILTQYKGWQDGGICALPVTKLDVDSSIGGRKSLEELIADSKEQGIDFYLYTDGIRANPETGNTTFNTVKKMDKRLYEEEEYKTVYDTFVFWTPQKSYENLMTLQKNLAKKDIHELALGGVCNTLFTYTLGDTMQTRSVSKYLYDRTLEELSGNTQLLLETPAACYWKYTKAMTDMPTADSNYIYTDQSVPFLSIALKGIMPMYSDYVNFEANEREYFLKLVETGIYPSFYLTWEDPSALIYTNSSDVYTSQYSVYKEQIVRYYEELKAVNEAVAGSYIDEHEQLANGLVKVTYDNGVTIYINYSDKALSTDGITVEASDYVIGR